MWEQTAAFWVPSTVSVWPGDLSQGAKASWAYKWSWSSLPLTWLLQEHMQPGPQNKGKPHDVIHLLALQMKKQTEGWGGLPGTHRV